MKLLIDIPEHIYEHAKEATEDSRDEGEAMRAIANGIQQESRSEIPNTCGDAISRQAVLDEIDRRFDLAKPFKQLIESMPSVTLQQRTGRWEWAQYDSNPNIGNWHCSKCRMIIPHMPEETDNTPIYKWCPYCGARMEVEE